VTSPSRPLALAALGWPILPLHGVAHSACTCGSVHKPGRAGKHPRTPRGLKDATTDPGTIAAWWDRWPDANVGVKTGAGLFVIDVDPGGVLPLTLPPTVTATTPRGTHYYLRTEAPLRSSSGLLGPGIDTRGEGGYVLAPPSRTDLGGYRWKWSPLRYELAEVPRELVERLLMPRQTTVVNLRHEAYDVYIGRAGHGQSGYFGNPFRVGDVCARCGQLHTIGAATIDCFRGYFLERVERDEAFRKKVLGLKGKRLGCFCKPSPCHGDVIVEWLDRGRPKGGRIANPGADGSRSGEDAKLMIRLLQSGLPERDILNRFAAQSDKFNEKLTRSDGEARDYALRTLAWAQTWHERGLSRGVVVDAGFETVSGPTGELERLRVTVRRGAGEVVFGDVVLGTEAFDAVCAGIVSAEELRTDWRTAKRVVGVEVELVEKAGKVRWVRRTGEPHDTR
jgi:hypothetical protein